MVLDSSRGSFEQARLPEATEEWRGYPSLLELFPFQLPGTKVGRTWPISATKQAALKRWRVLADAASGSKGSLFVDPRFGRKSTDRLRPGALPTPASEEPIAEIQPASPMPEVARYAYRSFDRQWILADARLINLPRPFLWWAHSPQQMYLVSLLTGVVGHGPSVTASHQIPDLHFYRGSFGGKDVIPLYRDREGTPNVAQGVLARLGEILGERVAAEDLYAYVYGLLSSRAYTEKFWEELETPGLRIPLTRDLNLFRRSVDLGRTLLNLHTYGERFTECGVGVNPGSARLVEAIGPDMPEDFRYDANERFLQVGGGVVTPVEPEIWEYEVSGLQVLRSWLRYRLREPVGRARSSSSPLDAIRPDAWTRELDHELLELIWVLERTIALEADQAELLQTICDGPMVSADELPTPSDEERRTPVLPTAAGADEAEDGDESDAAEDIAADTEP